MSYDVITIGSGLGGLVASTLLAKRGKRVLLLEQHRIPGGYCTSYQRKGYTFSVPSVCGYPDAAEEPAALRALGMLDGIAWCEIDSFARYIYPDLDLAMPANDLAGCEERLRHAFPDDADAIATYFSDVARLQRTMSTLGRQRTATAVLSLLASLPRLGRLARVSFYEYMRHYTSNERLIAVLSSFWGYCGLPPKKIPALSFLMMSGECLGKPLLYPRDGFQAIPDYLAGKLQACGGEIRYRTGVASILLQGKRAIGVETEAGEVLHAGTVISNADTRRTFIDLVGRSRLSRRLAARVDAHTPSASGVSLHLGVDLDLSQHDLRYGSVFYAESWEDGDSQFDRARENAICFEREKIALGLQAPSLLSDRLAPAGKHVLHLLLMPVDQRYRGDFGLTDGRRGSAYRGVKQELAQTLIAKVEKLVPGLSRAIEVSEMATPLTFERYTGATAGAWYDGVRAVRGGAPSPRAKTPIQSLFLTGTKALGGGGLPCALLGGVATARAVLAAG